jgi:hypothetical protein
LLDREVVALLTYSKTLAGTLEKIEMRDEDTNNELLYITVCCKEDYSVELLEYSMMCLVMELGSLIRYGVSYDTFAQDHFLTRAALK